MTPMCFEERLCFFLVMIQNGATLPDTLLPNSMSWAWKNWFLRAMRRIAKNTKRLISPLCLSKKHLSSTRPRHRWKVRYSSWNETKVGTDVSILMTLSGSIWKVTEISEAKKLPSFAMKRILSSPIRHSPCFVNSWLGLWKPGRNLL